MRGKSVDALSQTGNEQIAEKHMLVVGDFDEVPVRVLAEEVV